MNIRDHPAPAFAIISRLTTFTASGKGHGAGEPFAGAIYGTASAAEPASTALAASRLRAAEREVGV